MLCIPLVYKIDVLHEYARTLNCTQLNCLAGIPPVTVSAQQAHETFVANLQFAAAELAKAGISLVIEAINTRDIPSFFLTTTAQALAVIKATESTNIRVQYDIYHMQVMEGDIATTLSNNLVQIQREFVKH